MMTILNRSSQKEVTKLAMDHKAHDVILVKFRCDPRAFLVSVVTSSMYCKTEFIEIGPTQVVAD